MNETMILATLLIAFAAGIVGYGVGYIRGVARGKAALDAYHERVLARLRSL